MHSEVSMTMIERVAASIVIAQQRGLDRNGVARAAIEAMREPTPEMQAAIPAQSYTIEHYHGSGHHREFPTLSAGPLGIWRAMIDQALKDEA